MKNKDKFTQENVQAAWKKHCSNHPSCNNCPYLSGMSIGEKDIRLSCFIRWLYGEENENSKN